MLLSAGLLGYFIMAFFLGYGLGWLFRLLEHMGSDFLK
jgi:hypothetical protein